MQKVAKFEKVSFENFAAAYLMFKGPTNIEIIKSFVETPNRYNNPEMFYLWGHSYEFDDNDNWDVIEKFAEYAGGHEHIWYATNIEIYDYVKAYERLQTSYDKKIVHNPSSIDVWVEIRGNVYCVGAGKTIFPQ